MEVHNCLYRLTSQRQSVEKEHLRGNNLERSSSNATCAWEWKTNCNWLNVFKCLFILQRECQSKSKGVSFYHTIKQYLRFIFIHRHFFYPPKTDQVERGFINFLKNCK